MISYYYVRLLQENYGNSILDIIKHQQQRKKQRFKHQRNSLVDKQIKVEAKSLLVLPLNYAKNVLF